MSSNDAKYIVFDTGLDDCPIIFPNTVTHSTVAMTFSAWMPLSAGFVKVNDDGSLTAYGESVSIKLKSNPKTDNKILAKMFRK